ncbi:hypothetical protein HPB52_002811 [Rhipicephalus sanguineus]|uniref:Uncharacterized protein n=1 Tax=Rhipicephalus sanguineus TaxID=34632 RepID=A0A9D4PWI6_RHISA|nr:hypothetical protein HPB52_002811 [Rhipicephalus sanguineus]
MLIHHQEDCAGAPDPTQSEKRPPVSPSLRHMQVPPSVVSETLPVKELEERKTTITAHATNQAGVIVDLPIQPKFTGGLDADLRVPEQNSPATFDISADINSASQLKPAEDLTVAEVIFPNPVISQPATVQSQGPPTMRSELRQDSRLRHLRPSLMGRRHLRPSMKVHAVAGTIDSPPVSPAQTDDVRTNTNANVGLKLQFPSARKNRRHHSSLCLFEFRGAALWDFSALCRFPRSQFRSLEPTAYLRRDPRPLHISQSRPPETPCIPVVLSR